MFARHEPELREGGVRERSDGVDAATEEPNHVELREDGHHAHGVASLVRLEHREAMTHAHRVRERLRLDGGGGGVVRRRHPAGFQLAQRLQSRVALVDGERRGGLDERRVRSAGMDAREHPRRLALAAKFPADAGNRTRTRNARTRSRTRALRVEKTVRDDVKEGGVVAVAAVDEFPVGGGANGRERRREEILGDGVELLHALFAGERVGV